MSVDPSRKAKFLASILALVMLALCLCIPLDAMAGGSRSFRSRGRGFNSRDFRDCSRGFCDRDFRGRDFRNRGRRGFRNDDVEIRVGGARVFID